MNRKINLIAPVLLVLTLCMLARPAAAFILPSQSWAASGTGFLVKNGVLKYGPATILINTNLIVAYDGHSDSYPHVIVLGFPDWMALGASAFWWTITNWSVLPNGNILLYAVPVYINTYGVPAFALFLQAGPAPINVLIMHPITAPGNVHYGHSWIQVTPEHALSLNVAYFYGWNTPNV